MINFDWFGLFSCDPNKNVKCAKTSCHIYGGPCKLTCDQQYEKELHDMDNLEAMLKKQRDFQVRLDPNFLGMSVKERVAFIKEHSIHLNQEVNEMLYELPYFKPWKDYSSVTPEKETMALAKARMECIDAWHFFMNIMLALGFTADEFMYMYMKKNEENHRRQDDGYTADKSYRDQSVEEVMGDKCHYPFGSAEYVLDKIRCPQFGDEHYGDWGALTMDQRRAMRILAEHDMRLMSTLDALLKELEEAKKPWTKSK